MKLLHNNTRHDWKSWSNEDKNCQILIKIGRHFNSMQSSLRSQSKNFASNKSNGRDNFRNQNKVDGISSPLETQINRQESKRILITAVSDWSPKVEKNKDP